MYSNPHATLGLIITTTSYALIEEKQTALFVGGFLATISHWFFDFIGEAGLTKYQVLIHEVGSFILFFFLGFLSGNLTLFITAWIGGNFMDLVDKKMYLTVFFPKKFNPTYYFHKQKPLIRLTNKQTVVASIVSNVVIILIFLIL